MKYYPKNRLILREKQHQSTHVKQICTIVSTNIIRKMVSSKFHSCINIQMCTPLLPPALGVSTFSCLLVFPLSVPLSFGVLGDSGNGGLSCLALWSRLGVSFVPESFIACSLGVAFFRPVFDRESDLDLGEAFGLSFFGDSGAEVVYSFITLVLFYFT